MSDVTHPMIPVTVIRKQYVVESVTYTGEVPRELLADLDLDTISGDGEGSDLDQYVCDHLAAGEPVYDWADERHLTLSVTVEGVAK